MPHASLASASARSRWVTAALLGAGTALLYARAVHHGFLWFDDNEYVTENPVVREGLSWAGLRWAFATISAANWFPLTWLSHMLDVQLFGLDAGAHHLVNVVLHAANAALLFLALARMTGAAGRSAAVAALFAVHPLHVESVAWIAERKDVLSTFFGLLMLLAYASYAERPRLRRYGLVAACLLLSLLSKPMWVTAPFLLLLLDFWPLQRVARVAPAVGATLPPFPRLSIARLVDEKVPLLALSIASAGMTVVAQDRGGAVAPLEMFGVEHRIGNALVSYARYLAKAFWPDSLAAFYPQPAGWPAWQLAGAGLLVAGASAIAIWQRRRMPWLGVGWFWFLGTLVPVIGLVQVGSQAMADRYTYLPLIGIFISVVWTVEWLARAAGPRGVLAIRAAAAVALAILCAATHRQIGYWSDQVTLFRHALAVTEENGRAHLILSQALAARGDFPEALVHAHRAALLDPGNARASKNLGFVLYRMGMLDEAIAALERAVALDPGYGEAHGNLGLAYAKKGWLDRAMREMSLEMRLRPNP